MVEALLSYPGHLITTMRSKTEWVVNNEGGKAKPVRVGLAPEQGKGIEYEFDQLLEIGPDHVAQVIKDRTGKFQGRLIERPDEAFGQELASWFAAGPSAPSPSPESPRFPLHPAQGLSSGQALPATVPLPNGSAITPSASPRPEWPRPEGSGQSLSSERVEGLHRELTRLGISDHYALAARVLSRPVATFTTLTEAEARLIWHRARNERRLPPAPVSDEAAAAVLG
jgi:hypothetical protein